MSNILQKRTKRFTSSIYTGRLLNEHIIFKNESNFLQKKYTLRQAQALQIYGIVQKLQHYKQRGLVPDAKELDIDVKAACAALQGTFYSPINNFTSYNSIIVNTVCSFSRFKALQWTQRFKRAEED